MNTSAGSFYIIVHYSYLETVSLEFYAGLWGDVRDIYLEKKCLYSDEKKSRTLFAETINEVFENL